MLLNAFFHPVACNLECLPFLQCLLRNVRVLILDWTRRNGNNSRCIQIAIYEYEPPRIISSGAVGRPKLQINEDQLIQLRSFGFTWKP